MKVAAVILNYNSLDDSRKCISYLKRQEGVELEIILVDNCSSDAKAAEVFCKDQGCTFIASHENRGYNAGNNIGLRYAAEKGYKYALIANPDMEFPQTDYIKKLVATMKNDADIVVVGSDIIGPDNIHQNPIKHQNRWNTSFCWIGNLFRSLQNNVAWVNVDDYKNNHYCQELNGCCFLISIEFITEIGFFDEYPFLYCEETILSEQVSIKKKRMYYLIDTYAIHRHIDSTKGSTIMRIKHWERSQIYLINQYSKDPWIGKQVAKLSFYIYFLLLKMMKRTRT